MEFTDKIKNSLGEKLEDKLNEVLKKKNGLEYHDDEVARNTEWSGISGGGANFTVHRIAPITPLKMMLKPAVWSFLFPILFGGIGLAALFIVAPVLAEKFGMVGYAIAAMFTMPFILGGIGIYIYLSTPCTLDKETGYFWIGRNKNPRPENYGSKKQVLLEEIHAIQLIKQVAKRSHSTASRNRDVTSYKLIFILKDASRLYVTGSGKAETIRTMAKEISAFLEIPVWDVI